MACRHKLKNWRREKSTLDRMTFREKVIFSLVTCIIGPALCLGFAYAMKYAFFIIMPLLMYWQYRDLKKWRQLH